jgi:tetratricopeptide (TPR) repeat protein
MQNAECRIRNAIVLVFCILHFAFCLSAFAQQEPASEDEFARAVFFGKKFAEMGEYSSAYEHLAKADALKPDQSALVYNMAVVLARAGRYVDEQEAVEKYQRLFPNGPETAMIRQASVALAPEQLAELRAHLAAEQEAVRRTDVSGRTRLLADFHVLIAAMLGNAVLAAMLAELVSRSSLIALMFQSAHSAEHSYEEHVAIVEALERHDPRAAVRLMESHLANVEKNLQLHPRVPDLAAALKPRA